MKKMRLLAITGSLALAGVVSLLLAADHVDAPAVAGTTADIADFYAFEGENPNNTVFIATLQGLLIPGLDTENATFDEDVLIEFNIDNTGDFKEDLVIQAIKRTDTMYFFGPNEPVSKYLGERILVLLKKNTSWIFVALRFGMTEKWTLANLLFYIPF